MKLQRVLLILIAVLFVWVAVLTSQLSGKPAASEETVVNTVVNGFSTDLTKIAEERASSVATVESDNTYTTAFFYRSEGEKSYFLTTYHTLGEEITLRLENGYSAPAVIKGYDIFSDLCLLESEIPYELSEIPIGNSELLKRGEFLLTFGNPRAAEYSPSVSLAMVSNRKTTLSNQLSFEDNEYVYYLDLIQLSSSLTGGYYGGPVLNLNGELIGINCFSLRSSDGVSFALPSNEISLIAEKLFNGEAVKKTMFGLRGKPVRDMRNYEKAALAIELTRIEGYYVQELRPDSLAGHAGVQPGDILLRVNETAIVSESDLMKVQYDEVEAYDFLLERGGQEISVRLSITRESEPGE